MEETPAPNPVRSLIEAIRFLSALRAQLLGEGDADARGFREYGDLVPYQPLEHLEYDESTRISEEMDADNGGAAFAIEFVIHSLRELLERHERSRTVREPRLLHWYIGAPYLREDDLIERLVEFNLPIRPLWHALRLARSAHEEQSRDDGASYLDEHVFPLTYEAVRYLAVKNMPEQMRLECALIALLHDSMEDSKDGPESQFVMVRHFLGVAIADAVRTLSKRPKADFAHLSPAAAKEEREAEYMRRVAAAPYTVRLVKVLDRINNLLCVHKSPAKIEGYIEETKRYHLPLAAEIDTELVEEMRYVIQSLEKRLDEAALEDDGTP